MTSRLAIRQKPEYKAGVVVGFRLLRLDPEKARKFYVPGLFLWGYERQI